MNEFKVGLLALSSMVAVVFMSLQVTKNQSGFGDYIPYRTIIKDASGIFPKTPIKVAGINAGRIKNIELQGNNALITFEMLEGVKVSKNSELQIRTVGFLGDKYLEVSIGDSPVRLKENSLLRSREGGGMENIVKDASIVLEDVKDIIKSLKSSLAPVDEEPPVTVILNDTKEAVKSLREMLDQNKRKIGEIVENLNKFSAKLAYHTDENQKGSALEDLKKILGNVNEMTVDLKDIVADIKAGKGTMGKFLVEDEIADEVRETLAGVKRIVGRVDAIRTEISVFTGANTDYGGETVAALKIFPSPERFYLLGITTSEFGLEAETHTTRSTDGGTASTQIEKVSKKDTYRLNLQLGRQIQNWSLRGGLIESTGGLGFDYSFNKVGTRLTMEVFDYRSDLGINLRLMTEVHLWNVLFSRISGEDLLNDQRSATFLLGLRFNDEDLKGLLAFFI